MSQVYFNLGSSTFYLDDPSPARVETYLGRGYVLAEKAEDAKPAPKKAPAKKTTTRRRTTKKNVE